MIEALKKHPFLERMESKQMEAVAECASLRKFEQDTRLFREGEEATKFYLIQTGKVLIEIAAAAKGRISIQTVSKGDVLGWSWLVPPYKWRFDARALQDTEVIELDAQKLRKKCDEDPVLGYLLARRLTYVMTKRLEGTRLQLMDLYGTNR